MAFPELEDSFWYVVCQIWTWIRSVTEGFALYLHSQITNYCKNNSHMLCRQKLAWQDLWQIFKPGPGPTYACSVGLSVQRFETANLSYMHIFARECLPCHLVCNYTYWYMYLHICTKALKTACTHNLFKCVYSIGNDTAAPPHSYQYLLAGWANQKVCHIIINHIWFKDFFIPGTVYVSTNL